MTTDGWIILLEGFLIFGVTCLGVFINAKVKSLATKKEVIDIAKATEEIKDEIHRGSLVQVERWKHKKETYMSLSDYLMKFRSSVIKISLHHKEDKNSKALELDIKEYTEATDQLVDATREIKRLCNHAAIYFDEESLGLIDRFTNSLLSNAGDVVENPSNYYNTLKLNSDILLASIRNDARTSLFPTEDEK